MFQAEFVRSLNCNYERILLDEKPEENRYQYCIVSRGGIRGLLPCSLRYINGEAYLYYDISSTQNVMQLYSGRKVDRSWMRDFLWNMQKIRQELERFLLDEGNLIWYPAQIFQDLEKNNFYFMYIPYHEGETGFGELLEYLVESIDYEDEILVECVYKMYEQYESLGPVYLQEQIYTDGKVLNGRTEVCSRESTNEMTKETGEAQIAKTADRTEGVIYEELQPVQWTVGLAGTDGEEEKNEKKGIRYLLDSRRKKQKEERAALLQQTRLAMAECAVCEESVYVQEDLGRTVYMEENSGQEQHVYKLYTVEGKVMAEFKGAALVIGKKKEEADCVLAEGSVSRLHARITLENGEFYLEDLNSTNGTFKNGLRMQPYEKRILQPEDELKLGKITLIFR